MSVGSQTVPITHEAVAVFPDRAHFRRAVQALINSGFDRNDLSVLASHEALPAAEEDVRAATASLTDEIVYIVPLTIAGISVLSGGPIAATVAALVAAGLGGAALKEVFDRYTAAPHRKEFADAFAAGRALLWVRCKDREIELRALRILEECGGKHVHIHAHPA